MSKADTLRKAHKDAVEYVGYIGRRQHHLNSDGKLHGCKVETEINFQHSSGSTNYWKHSDFDKALEKVIRINQDSLFKQALDIMKGEADNALLEEEEALRERLKDIERIKKG